MIIGPDILPDVTSDVLPDEAGSGGEPVWVMGARVPGAEGKPVPAAGGRKA